MMQNNNMNGGIREAFLSYHYSGLVCLALFAVLAVFGFIVDINDGKKLNIVDYFFETIIYVPVAYITGFLLSFIYNILTIKINEIAIRLPVKTKPEEEKKIIKKGARNE